MDEALKAEPKKEEAKPQQQAQPTPLPPKKPAPPVQTSEPKPPTDQKFDADKIAALLDKRAPQRQAAGRPTDLAGLLPGRAQGPVLDAEPLRAGRLPREGEAMLEDAAHQ